MAFLDTSTISHLLILSVTAGLTLLFGLIIWRARRTVMNRELRKIPRSAMCIHREDMSRKQHEIIMKQLAKRQETIVEPLPHLSGQVGWGKTGTVYENIHFKVSEAFTFLLIEQAVTHRYPQLARRESQSVRSYLTELEMRCPALDKKVVNEYLVDYEHARFGQDEITMVEYQQFMKNLLVLVQTLDTADIDVEDIAIPQSQTPSSNAPPRQ